jgi:hypothetical protein
MFVEVSRGRGGLPTACIALLATALAAQTSINPNQETGRPAEEENIDGGVPSAIVRFAPGALP